MWISGNATLKHDKTANSKSVIITDLKEEVSTGLPKGHEVNARLADPNSDLHKQVKDVLANGGEVYIGRVRAMNGGGVYEVPVNLDLTCAAGTHDAMWDKLCQKLGQAPDKAYPVVFRDWGAPGTYGVCDGGGAGRGERKPIDSFDFLLKHCLAENLGEIGLVVHQDNHEEFRVRYELPFDFSSLYDYHTKVVKPISDDISKSSKWLDDHIIEEWARAHGSVPAGLVKVKITLGKLPDTMIFENERVENVKIAIELQSASIECLTMSQLTFDLFDGKIRFRDLESRNGKGLNRRIAVVLRYGDKLAMIFYGSDGLFDPNCPILPITDETIHWYGNDKFAAVIEMIRV